MDNFAARLQMNRERLSVKELQLAAFLQAHQQRASSLTISALSTAAGVSTATVSRFAKNLGYVNYAGLRVALGQAPVNGASLFEEIDPGESPLAMADKVFAANINALQATVNSLDATSLATAVDLLLGARFIDLYGLGGSNIVALDGYHKFLRTPLEVRYAADYHMQLMAATRLTKRDVAVLISHTGEDKDALALAQICHDRGAKLIVITGSAHSAWPSSPTSCWSVLRRKRLTAPRPCTR
nr:MurR/RpiR family transcriptional regulator [Lacticaseibacillus nasuensis]